MLGFQALAVSAALLRQPGRMLGIAALVILAACSRTDTPAPGSALPPGQSTAALPQAAQKGSLARSGTTTSRDKQPTWSELTPAQQQALAPLATEWNSLGPIRKKKWLEIAARYAQMTPTEQQRLQTRMREWTQLTPEQRRIARESYARAKKLDADQKSARWEQYQSLPDEEKQKLAAKAEKKKNVVNLPHPQANRNKPKPANPAAPVLPSAPAEPESAVAATAPPPTPPATAPASPAAGPAESLGGPLSYSPK